MPGNKPDSPYEERLAVAIKESWLNPFRTRVLSDMLGFHRMNYKVLHAALVKDLGLGDADADHALELLREYL